MNFFDRPFPLIWHWFGVDITNTFGFIPPKNGKSQFFPEFFSRQSIFQSFLVGSQLLNHRKDRLDLLFHSVSLNCLWLFSLQSYEQKGVSSHAFRPLPKKTKITRLRKICMCKRWVAMIFELSVEKWFRIFRHTLIFSPIFVTLCYWKLPVMLFKIWFDSQVHYRNHYFDKYEVKANEFSFHVVMNLPTEIVFLRSNFAIEAPFDIKAH